MENCNNRRRGARAVVFVCIGMDSDKGDFVSKVIQSLSQEEASAIFFDQTGIKAQTIHGPFRHKRKQVLENTRTLKFANEQKRAIYNDWEVNALLLKEPADHAYLIFLKRTDGKKQSAPKGTIVVPISDLRIDNE
jgi:hypothetical protein